MSYLIGIFEQGSIDWLLVMICPILIGMAKVGLNTIATPVVPILAGIFGGRPSTGILLPMLSIADVFAVKYYHRHAQWRYILDLLPWAVLGIALGIVVGGMVNDVHSTSLRSSARCLATPSPGSRCGNPQCTDPKCSLA